MIILRRKSNAIISKLLTQIEEIKNDWITEKKYYRLNHYEKKELALHIATQYLRHPLIAEAEADNYVQFEQAPRIALYNWLRQ